MASIERLKRQSKVERVDDERAIGNGIIVTLRKGWTFDPSCDNRVAGDDSVHAAVALVRRAARYEGPFEP
jgi:hypothetical protein